MVALIEIQVFRVTFIFLSVVDIQRVLAIYAKFKKCTNPTTQLYNRKVKQIPMVMLKTVTSQCHKFSFSW